MSGPVVSEPDEGPLEALVGLRVLDLSDGVAGAYAAKLLGDAGAEVLKVEGPEGHPLRQWSASGAVGSDGEPDGVLFRHLAAGHRSVMANLGEEAGRARVLSLAAASDVVIETFAPGHLDRQGVGVAQLARANPSLTVVSITPFGQQGPRRHQASTEFLLQALVGSLHLHGGVAGPPLAVGGRFGEWAAGAYAAAGVLAARARTWRTGVGEHVDVSTLECLAVTLLCYPTLYLALPGGTPSQAFLMVPGIERCRDGYVGLATITVQQWHDVLAMVGRLDLVARQEWDDQKVRQREVALVRAEIGPWFLQHTCAEVLEHAARFRVPAAPVSTGATVTSLPQLTSRHLLQPNPRGGFPDPRPPFRSTLTSARPAAPAPGRAEHDDAPFTGSPTPPAVATPGGAAGLPLQGVRVLDLTAFWAGPFGTQYLAALGADVVKVESVQRPDPMRYSVTVPATTNRWYERGSLFLSVNLNKRGITLDLSRPVGRELFLRLVATADVVVENFTPRVMSNFSLTYDDLRAVRDDIIFLRMPGWGLCGPWSDRPAFASTMEQVSGMAWVSGWPDGPPELPGICDPLAGVHGAFAVLAALDQRRRTGLGQRIELSMFDMAVNVAVEQILEEASYGNLMTREGNRSPGAAPQGAYRCAAPDGASGPDGGSGDDGGRGPDEWVALAVTTDAQWAALCRVLGDPAMAADSDLSRAEGRRQAHERIDKEIAAWCARRDRADALARLREAGVAAEPVTSAYRIDADPQMVARRFFEVVDHPVVGSQLYPGWPMRLSGGPDRWYRSAAPLLGQHTDDVLRQELGLSEDEIQSLRDAAVIGDRPVNG